MLLYAGLLVSLICFQNVAVESSQVASHTRSLRTSTHAHRAKERSSIKKFSQDGILGMADSKLEEDATTAEAMAAAMGDADLQADALAAQLNSSPDSVSSAESSAEIGVFTPDSDLLVWDTTPQSGKTSKGWLTVPLDPDDSDSPEIKVRVKAAFATVQPAPNGLLYTHCGDLGNKKNCPKEWANQHLYDVLSMEQRGVGETGPRIGCKGMSKLDEKSKVEKLKKKYEDGLVPSVHDFTDCPCAMGDGAHPIANGISAAVDPSQKAAVNLHFQSMSARNRRCYEWSRWTLKGKGDTSYNFLDYVGTNRVVGDIDAFRRAVGAPKISLIGAGYGTLVTGMYATMQAEKVDKLMLNSCMDPELDAVKLAKETTMGFARTMRRLLQDCSLQPGCPLYDNGDAFGAFKRLYTDMRSTHGLSAPQALKGDAKEGKAFLLTPGLLTSWLLKHLSDNSGSEWTSVVEVLGDLTDDSKKVRTQAVRTVLNDMCAPLGAGSKIFSWQYGVCMGNQVEEADGTLLQSAVLGVDYAGRYTVDQATQMAEATYAEMGEYTSVYIGYLSTLFSWPALPQPAGTIGSPKVEAVVVANLYDPVSAYTSSQAMHNAFPAGSMLTWQGVGHIFAPGNAYDPEGAHVCNKALVDFMKNGKLPRTGEVCLNTKPLALSPKDWNNGSDEDDDDEDDQKKSKSKAKQNETKQSEAKSGSLNTKIGLATLPFMAMAWLLNA